MIIALKYEFSKILIFGGSNSKEAYLGRILQYLIPQRISTNSIKLMIPYLQVEAVSLL